MEPLKADQAPSAVLELVDGARDMRFAMTARTLARLRSGGATEAAWNDVTRANVNKVTRYRPDGERALESMVQRFERLGVREGDGPAGDAKATPAAGKA